MPRRYLPPNEGGPLVRASRTAPQRGGLVVAAVVAAVVATVALLVLLIGALVPFLPEAPVAEAAVASDLAADLTVRVGVGVDVGVGRAGPDRGDQLFDLAGRDALVGRPDDVARRDRAGYLAGLRAGRLAAAAAQERRHAALDAELAEVDVGELHGGAESRVAQLVVDLAAVDLDLQPARRRGRDRRHFLVSVQIGLHSMPSASASAAGRRDCDDGEDQDDRSKPCAQPKLPHKGAPFRELA